MLQDMNVATLIGDVIGSRRSGDRASVHRELTAAVREADEATDPVRPTVVLSGDEIQGLHPRLGGAVRASFAIRLRVHPTQIRFGIGWGPVQQLGEGVEDGAGWWSARSAITSVHELEAKAATRAVRTCFMPAEDAAGPVAPEAVNAALLCRDQVLAGLDGRDIRIVTALMRGRSQTEIAADEGVSVSAVSQRISRKGIGVLLRANELLHSL